jgi:hypothetical protein
MSIVLAPLDMCVVASGASATEHRLLVGFEHSHLLSGTRRMIIDANVGSSVVRPSASADGSDPRRQYLPSGDVAAAWQFSESWQAAWRVSARPGIRARPSRARVRQWRHCRRRWPAHVAARLRRIGAVLSGASAFNRDRLSFDTYGADVRIRFAVTRTLAVYGSYLYYYYDFPRNALAPGNSAEPREKRRSRRSHAVDTRGAEVVVLPGKKYTLEEIVQICVRRWWLILLPLALGTAAGDPRL